MNEQPPGKDHQRNGLGLVLAAARGDHDAMTRLLTDLPPDELMKVTVFCAGLAAYAWQQLGEQDPQHDYISAMQTAAAHLAGRPVT